MKKYNLFKIILIAIGITALLSWLIPASYYLEGGMSTEDRAPVGIWHMFTYFGRVLQYAGSSIFFILIVGGFYGILNKTGVYKQLVSKVVDAFKGAEKLFLITITIVLAFITSFTGLSLGLFLVFPLIISVLLIMGYDRLTILTSIIGGVLAGIIGATCSRNFVGITNTEFDLTYQSEILSRVFLLIISIFLLVMHINNNLKKSKLNRRFDDPLYLDTKESKKKLWPMVTVIVGLLFIMILSSIEWQDAFAIECFNNIHNSIMNFDVFSVFIFRNILGNVPVFGSWSVSEFSVLVLIASIILILVYKIKLDNAIEAFVEGSRKVLSLSLLVGLIYVVFMITSNHLFYFTIIDWLLNLTKTFNIVTMMIATMLGSALSVEMPFFSGVFPIFKDMITDAKAYSAMVVLFQSIYGLTMLVVPTSVMLIIGLHYLDIPYLTWIKHIYKYAIQLLIVITIVLTAIVLI